MKSSLPESDRHDSSVTGRDVSIVIGKDLRVPRPTGVSRAGMWPLKIK
ncbi:hypothetical protein [Algoriphagus aquimarinus]|nr:hypothetical protein [Algoriphagus aquimarinus]